MDNEKLRKRGWSIQSETSAQNQSVTSTQTAQSEQELTEEEKRKLLDNFPRQEDDENYHNENQPNKRAKLDEKQPQVGSTEDKKKSGSNGTSTKDKVPPELLAHAKSKLSKWAARLFDPNRPRGLVQAPQIIPLSDEFLTAFGKREKLFDEKLGRKIAIDKEEITTNDHEEEEDDDDEKNGIKKKEAEVNNKKDFGNLDGRKLKITNLPYVLDKEYFTKTCAAFGPVSDVHLIMDKDGQLQGGKLMNIGKAYVIFEKPEDAKNCMEKMLRLKGRALRISMAEKFPQKNNKGSRSATSRYYVQDISTKCFRCGKIGHMEVNCPNPAKLKPCAWCGKIGHDMRDCTLSKVCFRCGCPGHINRDCPEREAIGRKRIVCGICFGSGHHRVSCQAGPFNAPNVDQAKCMVCGSLGHFMCQEMKWFFGLEGVTCFNCGRNDHHGYRCDRPNFEVCLRDEVIVKQELERQQVSQLADEYLQQQNRGRDRSTSRDSRNIYRPRVQSQPPPPQHGYNVQRDNGRGYSGATGHRSVRTQDPRFSNRRKEENRGYSTFR